MSLTATVLLPVFNAAEYLEESLQSLFVQTHADFEILAIDDGSTDASPAILRTRAKRDGRIRVVTQPENRGLVEALNLGMRSTSNRYVFRHDADDRARPDRLAKSLEFLGRHPEVALLGGAIDRIDAAGRTATSQRFPITDAEIRWQFLFRNPFAHSTVVFDREKAIAAGGYAKDAVHAEDYDLWTRLAERGRLANLPETLCDYRDHGESVSSRQRAAMERQSARIGARWLARLAGATTSGSAWERLRNRDSLSPAELNSLVATLVGLAETHPELSGYPPKKAVADLVWHLLSYLKRRPEIAANPKLYGTWLRLLPALREWPAARWRSA